MSAAIIFTDLDGTLMDHHTYSLAAALPTVQALSDRGIPVIPCTSKTRAETAKIMASLGLSGPMIV